MRGAYGTVAARTAAPIGALLATALGLGTGIAFAAFPGNSGQIAYSTYPSYNFFYAIHLAETGQITFPTQANDGAPQFSPDGEDVAFIRQYLTSPRDDQLFVVRKTGNGLRAIVHSDTFSENAILGDPAWLPDGRLSFTVRNSSVPTQNGIWRVRPGVPGLTQIVPGVTWISSNPTSWGPLTMSWSPTGARLLYTCQLDSSKPRSDLCIYDETTGETRPILVEWPMRAAPIYDPEWTADEEKIVFSLGYSTSDNGRLVNRIDIFSMPVTGGSVTKLTDSGPDICAPNDNVGVAAFIHGAPTPSPDNNGIAFLKRRVALADDFNQPQCTYRQLEHGIYEMNMNGGTPRLVQSLEHGNGVVTSSNIANPAIHLGLDWQTLPVALTVNVDDGHGNPLHGLKLELLSPEDQQPVPGAVPENKRGGHYAFEGVPAGDYLLRATLVDNLRDPPAFDIRHRDDWNEPVWIWREIKVPPGATVVIDLHFENSPKLLDSNVLPENRDHLDDMASIYFQTRRFVDWVKENLTPNTGARVPLLTFATHDPITGEPFSPHGGHYRSEVPHILIGVEASKYEDRDGITEGFDDDAPENTEWHEFVHHLTMSFVEPTDTSCPGENHDGWRNPSTCDSVREGLAIFLPAYAARDIKGESDSFYANFTDLETHIKAWYVYPADESRWQSIEDFAVGALVWDLIDDQADTEDTIVINQDGQHVPVTYVDLVSYTVTDLWNHLTSVKPTTVGALWQSLSGSPLERDLDGDGSLDVSNLDMVFLMHGFFPVIYDQNITETHQSYHYNVDGVPIFGDRNALVGRSDHVYDQGSVTHVFEPRHSMPLATNSNLTVNVRDASGTPLSGAKIELVIGPPGKQSTLTRTLGAGEGSMIALRLPPYFDYHLPDGAPPPPCNPASPLRVNVQVRSTVNGYVSQDSPTFDNCEWIQAVATASGPAALAVTTTFPEDSTAPATTLVKNSSAALVQGATTGAWIVRLACNDPVDGDFASGCARTEYSLDGGPLTTYQRKIVIDEPGEHTLSYRSVDAAANEEDFQIAMLAVFDADTDDDGVPDESDNCILVPNADQRDTDGDGYGNICDPDFNNNGIVDSQDGALFRARFGSTSDPDQDLNGNGIVDSQDGALLRARFGLPPGPSGLVTPPGN